jgi:hypothetical protein
VWKLIIANEYFNLTANDKGKPLSPPFSFFSVAIKQKFPSEKKSLFYLSIESNKNRAVKS